MSRTRNQLNQNNEKFFEALKRRINNNTSFKLSLKIVGEEMHNHFSKKFISKWKIALITFIASWVVSFALGVGAILFAINGVKDFAKDSVIETQIEELNDRIEYLETEREKLSKEQSDLEKETTVTPVIPYIELERMRDSQHIYLYLPVKEYFFMGEQ